VIPPKGGFFIEKVLLINLDLFQNFLKFMCCFHVVHAYACDASCCGINYWDCNQD
jgi:hypothetical protein